MITIMGRVASKKNSNKWNGKFVYKSKAWTKFEKDAVSQIKKQHSRRKPIAVPVLVNYRFYLKGKGNIDLDNMIGGINDCLEQGGVIENDRNIFTINAFKVIEQPEYITEIEVHTF